MTHRELYRRSIDVAAKTAVLAPLAFSLLAFESGEMRGLFPWVAAEAVVAGLAASICFGVPAFVVARLFLWVARDWGESAHFAALILSPILMAALLSAIVLATSAMPPNELPPLEVIPGFVARFSLIILVPGYAFVAVSLLTVRWLSDPEH